MPCNPDIASIFCFRLIYVLIYCSLISSCIPVSYNLGSQAFHLAGGYPTTLQDGTSVTFFNYTTTLPNKANLSIDFIIFQNRTSYKFANQTISVSKFLYIIPCSIPSLTLTM